jgi:hypothetical protein
MCVSIQLKNICKSVHELLFQDINECDKSAKCVDGVCINLDGSWSCDCQDGKQPERFNSTLTVCRGKAFQSSIESYCKNGKPFMLRKMHKCYSIIKCIYTSKEYAVTKRLHSLNTFYRTKIVTIYKWVKLI